MDRSLVKPKVDESLQRIREHPFIRKAKNGEASRDQCLRWIFCAGRESRTFPEVIRGILCSPGAPQEMCEVLEANLRDELGNGNIDHAHFTHYLQLIDRLGVSRETFTSYSQKAGIELALSLALNIGSTPNPSKALGYMLVNEGMTEITYSAVKQSVQGIWPDVKTTFFDLHIEVDEQHVNQLYLALESLPEAAVSDVLFGVSIGERGMAVLLDEALGEFEHVPYHGHVQIPMFWMQHGRPW